MNNREVPQKRPSGPSDRLRLTVVQRRGSRSYDFFPEGDSMALYARVKQLGEIAHHREKGTFPVITEQFECENPDCPCAGHVHFIFAGSGQLTIAFDDPGLFCEVLRIVTHLTDEALRQAAGVRVRP